MAISEQQLTAWSHQGSKVQSAATYETVRNTLRDPGAPYARRDFDIFLQGSYGNDTNIYADSDVDVVVCLTPIYYSDISSLNITDTARYNQNRVAADYSYEQFKAEVLQWLRQRFGQAVRAGKKAIFIPGNGNRRDADVLVCVEHRAYHSYGSSDAPDFWEGICFWTPDGTKIVNYPKQHSQHCTSKHQNTASRFKPNVRALKNMRNRMIDQRLVEDGVAPSYFLEGMLSNVPNTHYANTFQQTIANYLAWLEQCDPTQLLCANQRHYLIRDGYPVCWNSANFSTFLTAAKRYWNFPT